MPTGVRQRVLGTFHLGSSNKSTSARARRQREIWATSWPLGTRLGWGDILGKVEGVYLTPGIKPETGTHKVYRKISCSKSYRLSARNVSIRERKDKKKHMPKMPKKVS